MKIMVYKLQKLVYNNIRGSNIMNEQSREIGQTVLKVLAVIGNVLIQDASRI